MTLEEVKLAVREIQAAAKEGDYEKAHSLEDQLYHSVLLSLATTMISRHSDMAKMALRTQELKFDRHCA